MSLHDVSKDHDKRISPMPNQVDQQQQRMAHNTAGITNRRENAANKQRVAFKQGVILTYDNNGLVSSVYGYIPSVSAVPVLIIAKVGYDVYIDILGITPPTV